MHKHRGTQTECNREGGKLRRKVRACVVLSQAQPSFWPASDVCCVRRSAQPEFVRPAPEFKCCPGGRNGHQWPVAALGAVSLPGPRPAHAREGRRAAARVRYERIAHKMVRTAFQHSPVALTCPIVVSAAVQAEWRGPPRDGGEELNDDDDEEPDERRGNGSVAAARPRERRPGRGRRRI